MQPHQHIFVALEIFCSLVFILEYLARFTVCFHEGITRYQYVISPMALCDLVAIAPFFVDMALSGGNANFLKLARSVRLVRLSRLFKLSQYLKNLGI